MNDYIVRATAADHSIRAFAITSKNIVEEASLCCNLLFHPPSLEDRSCQVWLPETSRRRSQQLWVDYYLVRP